MFPPQPTHGRGALATFYRLPSGLWRAQIHRRGVRRSATFENKGQAIAWAGQQESEIMAGVRGQLPNLTVLKLLERYAKEVSTGKKGERWELIRLEALGRDRMAQVRLKDLDTPHLSDWQTRRLKSVSSASVRRERNLLNNVFEIARKEWRWLRKNPFEGVRRPKDGRPRKRIATQEEIDRLTGRASPEMKRAILIALETGMRASEIASKPEVKGRVAYLQDTKNGEFREVPLSKPAVDLLAEGVNLEAGSISTMFRGLCQDAGVKGLTFHDLRRTAIVRLAEKLSPLELAKMVGHRDLKMTLNVYYRADPEKVADKL